MKFPLTFFFSIWQKKKASIVPGEGAWFQGKVETAFSAKKAQAPAPVLSRCFSPLHHSAEVSATFTLSAAEHCLPQDCQVGLMLVGRFLLSI